MLDNVKNSWECGAMGILILSCYGYKLDSHFGEQFGNIWQNRGCPYSYNTVSFSLGNHKSIGCKV